MQTATEGQSYPLTNTAINPPTGINIQSKTPPERQKTSQQIQRKSYAHVSHGQNSNIFRKH